MQLSEHIHSVVDELREDLQPLVESVHEMVIFYRFTLIEAERAGLRAIARDHPALHKSAQEKMDGAIGLPAKLELFDDLITEAHVARDVAEWSLEMATWRDDTGVLWLKESKEQLEKMAKVQVSTQEQLKQSNELLVDARAVHFTQWWRAELRKNADALKASEARCRIAEQKAKAAEERAVKAETIAQREVDIGSGSPSKADGRWSTLSKWWKKQTGRGGRSREE